MRIDELKDYELPPATLTPMPLMTDAELQIGMGGTMMFDIECYRNFFLIMFMDFASGKFVMFERTNEYNFQLPRLQWILNNYRIVGYNSWFYDEPMLWASLANLWPVQLKTLSDQLILRERFGRAKAEVEWGFKIGFSNHIDIKEVAPAAGKYFSLKHYGGRSHSPKLQDLPIDPNKDLSSVEIQQIRHYCCDDCVTTAYLFSRLQEPIKLREEMGLGYGIELRSKSDAQIAERVIKEEIESLTGVRVNRPTMVSQLIQYQVPDFIKFHTPILQNALTVIRETFFQLNKAGRPIVPPTISKLVIPIGESVYNVGTGGLHSMEKKRAHFADDKTLLLDRDVASYYPQIILNQGLYPKHLGPVFLDVYKEMVDRRLLAKSVKDKSTADSLKITINGTFGKLGSQYSCIYSPDLLLQVTLTGQLALLMLIEMCEMCGIRIVSANTDGIVIKCSVGKEAHLNQIVEAWEGITNFVTEETRYTALYSKDVNNYIAIGTDGEFKAKGCFGCRLSMKEPNREGLMKNPEFEICNEAVMLFLRDQTPIEKTIKKCKDVTKFICVRKVNAGASKNKHYLGKAIRWYIRKDEYGVILNVKSKDMIPNSAGGMPVMTLNGMPNDVDYEWYIKRSLGILEDIGFNGSNEVQRELF